MAPLDLPSPYLQAQPCHQMQWHIHLAEAIYCYMYNRDDVTEMTKLITLCHVSRHDETLISLKPLTDEIEATFFWPAFHICGAIMVAIKFP